MQPLNLRVIKAGNSLSVRLPKILGMREGQELLAFRDGEALVLKPADVWPAWFLKMEPSPDFPMPEREGADASEARYRRFFGKA